MLVLQLQRYRLGHTLCTQQLVPYECLHSLMCFKIISSQLSCSAARNGQQLSSSSRGTGAGPVLVQLLQRAGQRGQDREASVQLLRLSTVLATDCPLR